VCWRALGLEIPSMFSQGQITHHLITLPSTPEQLLFSLLQQRLSI
jgi:hypothetical protein